MILEANKLQFERCTVLGYDALKTYDGFNVVRTTLVQGYGKATVSFHWTTDYPECLIIAWHPKCSSRWCDGAVIGRGRSVYDALLDAHRDEFGYAAYIECEDVIKDLMIQLTR